MSLNSKIKLFGNSSTYLLLTSPVADPNSPAPAGVWSKLYFFWSHLCVWEEVCFIYSNYSRWLFLHHHRRLSLLFLLLSSQCLSMLRPSLFTSPSSLSFFPLPRRPQSSEGPCDGMAMTHRQTWRAVCGLPVPLHPPSHTETINSLGVNEN